MFFIHNDQPQVRKRHKQSGSGPDDNIAVPILCPEPLIVFLSFGESGIKNGYSVSKPLRETADRLVRKGDLRDEHDRLFPFSDNFFDCRQIDLCLPASGNSMQKIRFPLPCRVICFKFLYQLLLTLIQGQGSLRFHPAGAGIPVKHFCFDADDAILFHTCNRCPRNLQVFRHTLPGNRLLIHESSQQPGFCRIMPA